MTEQRRYRPGASPQERARARMIGVGILVGGLAMLLIGRALAQGGSQIGALIGSVGGIAFLAAGIALVVGLFRRR
jgi:hypothetical protein